MFKDTKMYIQFNQLNDGDLIHSYDDQVYDKL